MLDDLVGKRVLVTGASTGIGAAAAKELAGAGATVALHYNQSKDDAESVAKAIRAAGGTCHLIKGDLTQAGEAKRVVEEAAKALGGLDVLVNNAGSLIKRMPFEELSDDLIDKVFDLNVRSVIEASQAAVPLHGEGRRRHDHQCRIDRRRRRRRARRRGLRRRQGLRP